MVEQNLHRTSRDMLPGARRLAATLLTVVAPKGCLIRTLQVYCLSIEMLCLLVVLVALRIL